MSLLKTSPESPPLTIPFKVRLEPYLVESVCDLARLIREKGSQNNDISGLLFGTVETGVRTIAALKTFVDMGAHSELARRQRWERAYKATADEAKNELELSQFEIVGWFSFRTGSGLLSSDLAFHTQHFRRTEDIALILWRDGPSQMTAEVYSKSENDTLTSDDYRWGSIRLSVDIRHMRESVELAMRTKLNDDSYLRTYEDDEPLSHFETLKRRAEAVSEKLFGFLNRGKEEAFDEKIRGLIGDGRLPGRSQYGPSQYGPSQPGFDAIEPMPPPQAYFNPYADASAGRNRPSFSEFPRPGAATPTPAPGGASPLAPNPVQPPHSSVMPPPAGAWPGSGAAFGTAPARIPERVPEQVPAYRSDFHFPESPLPLPMLAPGTALELSQIGRAPRTGRVMPNEIGGLPMVIRPPAPAKPSPWPWTIGVFLLCSSVVFGFLALGGLQGENGRLGQILQSAFPGSGLNLRVKNEDDRLRLSWNQRNRAVASASDATLQIFDGQSSREVHLDGRQVADGSVLYRPLTNDLTFRLVVRGDQGSVSGSVRLLDGLSSRQATLDVSSPAQNGSAQATGEIRSTGDPSAPVLLRGNTDEINDVASAGRLPRTPISASSAADSNPADNSPLSAYVPPAGTQLPGASVSRPVSRPTDSRYETPETIGGGQQPGSSGGVNSGGSALGGTTINGWDPAPVTTKSKPKTRTQTPGALGFGDAAKSTYVAPKPLVQVMPNVRSIPQGTLPVRTRVAVRVSVDSYGRVTNARVTGTGVNLKVAAAALSAAKQWLFDPAKDNGRRINSEHTIVFVLPAR